MKNQLYHVIDLSQYTKFTMNSEMNNVLTIKLILKDSLTTKLKLFLTSMTKIVKTLKNRMSKILKILSQNIYKFFTKINQSQNYSKNLKIALQFI